MELKPSKFDPEKLNRPDKFGQQYNNDSDQSKLSDVTAAESRRMHLRADTDLSQRSIHHTLGSGHNQAAPGDHDHSGPRAKRIGPLEMHPEVPGVVRPVWTLPVNATLSDVIILMAKFVNFRRV